MKWNAVKVTLLNEVIIKQDKKTIARLMGDNEDADYPTEKEREQNAKLIASAPELLEALKMLIDFPNDDLEHYKKYGVTMSLNELQFNKIVNAIKKATE